LSLSLQPKQHLIDQAGLGDPPSPKAITTACHAANHLLLDPKMPSALAEREVLDRHHQHARDAEEAANATLQGLHRDLRTAQEAVNELHRLRGAARDNWEYELADRMMRDEINHVNEIQSRIPHAQAVTNARKAEADRTYQELLNWGYRYDQYEHVSRRPHRY
jgi:hypothetical protein